MLNIDLTGYSFIDNIPKNELRAELTSVADEDGYLDDFVEAWQSGDLYYNYRDTQKALSPSTSTALVWHSAQNTWQAFRIWSDNSYSDVHNCRSSPQLGIKLKSRGLVSAYKDGGGLLKRKSSLARRRALVM